MKDTKYYLKKAINEINYPFSCRRSQYLDVLKDSNLAWWEKQGFIEDQGSLNKILTMRSWEVGAFCFPEAPLARLEIYTNWVTWVLLNDDFFDNDRNYEKKDKQKSSYLLKNYLNILNFQEESQLHILNQPLKILTQSFFELGQEQWISFFRRSVGLYFTGCLREVDYRIDQEVPKLNHYIKVRSLVAGLYPMFDIIELDLSENLSKNFKSSELFSNARYYATNILSWANDLYSFPKEISNQETFNILFVLIKHEQLTFQEAFEKAIQMHNQELERFLELEKKLKFLYPNDETIGKWFEGLKDWIVGAWTWTTESERYMASKNFSEYQLENIWE